MIDSQTEMCFSQDKQRIRFLMVGQNSVHIILSLSLILFAENDLL